MVEVKGLLERVAKATGPDRDIDCALWGHFVRKSTLHHPSEAPHVAPEFTANIDAAFALVQKVLPGWWMAVWNGEDGEWAAALDRREPRTTIYAECHSTGPIAIIAALLTALDSSPTGEGRK
jgi:hypothetical protein